MRKKPKHDILSRNEAAAFLKVCPQTITNYTNNGRLSAGKIIVGKTVRYFYFRKELASIKKKKAKCRKRQ